MRSLMHFELIPQDTTTKAITVYVYGPQKLAEGLKENSENVFV